ncbi:SERTA domain-containing protein 4 [Pelobates fuscus]|uniref:SERTA domain-containing protein 4 n=1 Tax=Pelobates fuscus TaxID=191477 RepID=UPI002FE4F110
MTVVLSMNRFCSPLVSEGAPEIPEYQRAWTSERQKKTTSSSSSHLHAQHPEHRSCDSPAESHYRGLSKPITTSKITYFKRKYLEEEDCHPPLSSCSHKNVSIFEERAHVLYMSLEKLKFIDDPEVFLRRSVLINNLMKRIHGEILMQNNWCFSACSLGGPSGQEWFVPQDCPYKKRLRIAKEDNSSLQTCCFYQDCGSHYLNIPFSVSSNSGNVAGSSSSTNPLPGTSQHMDLSVGNAAFYRNGFPVPSCGDFVTHGPRQHASAQKANVHDESSTDEKRGGLGFGYDVINGGGTSERRGRLYDFLAAGCIDKSSVSEPWKKSVRKKEVSAGNKLCCSKGSKM